MHGFVKMFFFFLRELSFVTNVMFKLSVMAFSICLNVKLYVLRQIKMTNGGRKYVIEAADRYIQVRHLY